MTRSVSTPSVLVTLLLGLGASGARAQVAVTDAADTDGDGDGPRPAAERSPATGDEAELARTARLDTILRLALERNRDLAESQARARAAEAHARAAARLPDLEFKVEQWGVPLAHPVSLDRADTLMFGVRQMFPAWGTLDARGRAESEQAGGARDVERGRRQDIAARVRRTYAAYYMADQERGLHLEHVGLTSHALEIAKLNQRTGLGTLADVLRLELEITRLHMDVTVIERDRTSSRAQLNALMDRPSDAPLGPAEELGDPGAAGDVATRALAPRANHPELAAAARSVSRAEASLEETRRAARLPSVMVGLDYWYLPTGTDVRHAYGAMLAINLPWLNPGRRDQEREAEQTLLAERHALESMRNGVRFQLRDAMARVDAARQSFALIDQQLLAQARHSLEVTQSAYSSGHADTMALLDALRSYLQVRIERVRARAELASSEAELARAAGTLAADGGGR